MIDSILAIDTQVFSFINSLHNKSLDTLMLELSYNYYLMAAFLVAMLTLTARQYKKKIIPLFFVLLVIFGLSDSISTRVFKNNIKRLRPCHSEELKGRVHLAGKKCWGGKFGFVSSHAANSFAISTFFYLLLKNYFSFTWLLYLYSFLVGYSRIYLGKHYPLDILGGAVLGCLLAYLLLNLLKKKFKRIME